MRFLKNIRSIFSSPGDKRNYWFSVRCDHCQETLQGRADLYNDLSAVYDSDNKVSGYYCRKVLIGSSGCYRPIEIELHFDPNRKINDKSITGGEFINGDG